MKKIGEIIGIYKIFMGGNDTSENIGIKFVDAPLLE